MDIYNENHGTFQEEVEDDTETWKNLPKLGKSFACHVGLVKLMSLQFPHYRNQFTDSIVSQSKHLGPSLTCWGGGDENAAESHKEAQEIPDSYSKLKKMKLEASQYWTSRQNALKQLGTGTKQT